MVVGGGVEDAERALADDAVGLQAGLLLEGLDGEIDVLVEDRRVGRGRR